MAFQVKNLQRRYTRSRMSCLPALLVFMVAAGCISTLRAGTIKPNKLIRKPAGIGSQLPDDFELSTLEPDNRTLRSARSTKEPTAVTPTCQTESVWVKLHHAYDMYKNRVEVLPDFQQNNTIVEQIFHERYCAGDTFLTNVPVVESSHPTPLMPSVSSHRLEWSNMLGKQKCFGIDSKAYHGYCITQHSFVYAKVKNQKGEDGWNVIRIRGGCECAVFNAL